MPRRTHHQAMTWLIQSYRRQEGHSIQRSQEDCRRQERLRLTFQLSIQSRGENVYNVGSVRGQSRVQQGGYGDEQGPQGALHSLPILHNDVMALRARGQDICTDARVDGQKGRRLLVALPAATRSLTPPAQEHPGYKCSYGPVCITSMLPCQLFQLTCRFAHLIKPERHAAHALGLTRARIVWPRPLMVTDGACQALEWEPVSHAGVEGRLQLT